MEYSVSGCIVTYNNINSIKNTVESVLENTKDINFKLYIVDNNSTDSTPEFIRENYPQVEVISTGENLGFGGGHNVLLDKLESKYHVLINPDISIRDNVPLKMAEYMDGHDEIGLLSPKICFPDGRAQILGKREPKMKYLVASRLRKEGEPSKLLAEYAMLDKDDSECYETEIASGCFLMVRTDLFKKIGGFDERYFLYFEDFDLAKTIRKTHKVVFFPFATVYHEWGRESKRNFKLMLTHIQSLIKFKLKWLFR